MKNWMITTICLIAICTLAGLYISPLDGSGTNSIPNATTNYFGNQIIVPIGNVAAVTIGVGFSSAGANSTTQTLSYSATFDGTHWLSNWFIWQVPANGTTAVFYSTNLTSLTNSVASLRLDSWGNPGTNILNPLHESYTKVSF